MSAECNSPHTHWRSLQINIPVGTRSSYARLVRDVFSVNAITHRKMNQIHDTLADIPYENNPNATCPQHVSSNPQFSADQRV